MKWGYLLMNEVIKILEPQRDKLYQTNQRLKESINLLQNLIDTSNLKIEVNNQKIKEIDTTLDNFFYNQTSKNP